MASTTFSSGTLITSTWLNDVNSLVWTVFNGKTTSGTSGTFLRSNGTNIINSTYTLPSAIGATSTFLRSDGTNIVASAYTLPAAVGSTGTILRSDGTNFATSTSTFADTYSISTILYASAANTVTGLATANSATLQTNGSGVPSLVANATAAQTLNATILTTKGDLLVATSSSAQTRQAVGTDGQMLRAQSGVTNGISWVDETNTGFRNKIRNGAMRIDQQNEGASVSVNGGGGFYGPDGVFANGTAAAGVYSMQRLASSALSNQFDKYLRITTTTADAAPAAASYYGLQWRIEGQDIADLNFGGSGALATSISFWARSSLSGTFSGALKNYGGTRSYPFNFTITSPNTWQHITIQNIPGDQSGTWPIDNSGSCIVSILIGAGANFTGTANAWAAANAFGVTGATQLIQTLNATLDITGIQFESGPVATNFEQRSFAVELALCQRYYWKSFRIGTAPAQNVGTATGEIGSQARSAGAATQWFAYLPFPVWMRSTAPTMTFYNPAAANAQVRDETNSVDCSGTTTQGNASNAGFIIVTVGNAASTAGAFFGVHATADARL